MIINTNQNNNKGQSFENGKTVYGTADAVSYIKPTLHNQKVKVNQPMVWDSMNRIRKTRKHR